MFPQQIYARINMFNKGELIIEREAILSQDESLSIKLSYLLLPKETQRLDLYFSLPIEMGINQSTLNEEEYFYANVKSHSAYYSKQIHLPLVRSRFISQTKGEKADYRLNLNLYSYQIRLALEQDIKQTLQIKGPDEFYPAAIVLVEQAHALLKKLRRYTPPDKKLKSYFDNADNFLSWHSEQMFLKLLVKGPKSSEFSKEREQLRDFCRKENNYRTEQEYNTQQTLDDPNRITNKMRLLQRLTEFGVVFSKDTRNLNGNLQRLVRGFVTAIIMAFVMFLVLNARSNFQEITLALIALLGVIYGLRETFKDDITRVIWRKIRKGRPTWRHVFRSSADNKTIHTQTVWLEHIKRQNLPKQVDVLFRKRRQQNKQAAHLIHYRCDSKVLAKEFLPGYDQVQQQVFFNLTPFVRYLKKGAGKLYTLEDKKITGQSVERRYQINLVVAYRANDTDYAKRYKITLNRSQIVNIEVMKD